MTTKPTAMAATSTALIFCPALRRLCGGMSAPRKVPPRKAAQNQRRSSPSQRSTSRTSATKRRRSSSKNRSSGTATIKNPMAP